MDAWRSWQAQLAAALALVLASGVALAVHINKPRDQAPAASPAPVVAVPFPPFPDCTGSQWRPSETEVTQQADGGFTGCLQVDQVTTGAYVVRAFAPASTYTQPAATRTLNWLSISPSEGPPGTLVTLTGNLPAIPPGGHLEDRVLLCWEGCDAIGEAVQMQSPAGQPGRFTVSLRVPSTPWLTDRAVHPLRPGSYRITLPCFLVLTAANPKGECGLQQVTGTFRLIGPVPPLCQSGQPCSTLEISPTAGAPGTVISVRGWAPLVGLGSWGSVHIQLRSAPTSRTLATLASAPFQVLGEHDDWASLGTLRPASVLRSDVGPIGVDPDDSRRFAYCSEGAIRLTSDGGRSWSSIPTDGAVRASAATNYPLPYGYDPQPVSCIAVALDPGQPASIYAEFMTVERHNAAPPFDYVAYYTTDAGVNWSPVPVPVGSDMGGFGGFRSERSGVRALFTHWSDSLPEDQPAVAVELTVDGGKTWSGGSLRCPPAGPCVTLGTKTWARCQAVEGWEAVLVSTDNGKTWATTNRIRSCWRVAQLVGLSDGRLVTLNGLDWSLFTLSEDDDRTWRSFALPQLPEQTDSITGVGNLELLSDGRLLSVSRHWSLLAPGASVWCTVPGSPTYLGDVADGAGFLTPLLIGDQFWWLDGTPATAHRFPLSALHC